MDLLKENDWVRINPPTVVAGERLSIGQVKSLETLAAGEPYYNVAICSKNETVLRQFSRGNLEKISESEAMLLKLES
jgi:hypothetical protein